VAEAMKTSTGLLMILASAAGAALGAALAQGRSPAARLLAAGIGFAAPWGLRAAFASQPSCSFLFLTDTHGPAAVTSRVVEKMTKEQGIQFVIHGGDFADEPRFWPVWWDDPAQPLLDRWDVEAVTGNHDVDTEANRAEFNRRFGPLPRAIRCGDAADIYLMPWAFNRSDAEWLWGQVRASTAQHRILVTHKAIWPVHDDDARLRGLVEPVIDRIDLILAGHDHVYQDSRHGGTRQVIEISGGKKYGCPASARGCVEGTTGYLRIDVSDSGIDVTRRTVP
jgi:predicted phosphodiesterase